PPPPGRLQDHPLSDQRGAGQVPPPARRVLPGPAADPRARRARPSPLPPARLLGQGPPSGRVRQTNGVAVEDPALRGTGRDNDPRSGGADPRGTLRAEPRRDRKSTRLNSSHLGIS